MSELSARTTEGAGDAAKLTLPRIEAMLRAGRVLFLPLGGDGARRVERLAGDTAEQRAGEEAAR